MRFVLSSKTLFFPFNFSIFMRCAREVTVANVEVVGPARSVLRTFFKSTGISIDLSRMGRIRPKSGRQQILKSFFGINFYIFQIVLISLHGDTFACALSICSSAALKQNLDVSRHFSYICRGMGVHNVCDWKCTEVVNTIY